MQRRDSKVSMLVLPCQLDFVSLLPPCLPLVLLSLPNNLQVSIDYNAGLTAALAGLLALEPDCCAATFP